MLERAASKRRRAAGTRFQRYAPLVSLILSTATFVLTTLLILPGTTKGSLENLHLLTLNTSNIGANTIQFTPITTQSIDVQDSAEENDHSPNGSQGLCNWTHASATRAENHSTCTNETDTTMSTSSPTLPTINNGSMTGSSSQPSCSCASNLLANITQDITIGIEDGLGLLVHQFIQNITNINKSNLTNDEGAVGLLLGGPLINDTTESGNGNSTGTSFDSSIQSLVSSLIYAAGSNLLDLLTGSGSRSGLKGLLSSIISNFTTKVDNGLSKAEGTVAEGITSALGIQEFYSLHLRDICSGMLSNSSGPLAKFNITACYPYSIAASGLVGLLSKIPSSTTVATTNITIPVIAQVQEMGIYLTHLTNTLDQIIFAFYIITLISSSFVILGSVTQFLLPTSGIIIYANIIASTLSAASALSASAAITAFITTANNIINIFGSALNLQSKLGTSFLVLTWTSFATAILTNWYLVVVWFVEFRTISVKVQRRSPQDLGNWRQFGVFRESKGGFVEETVQEMDEERPDRDAGNTNMTIRRLSSRFGRRNSVTANF